MNLDSFLELEKRQLQYERERLSARSTAATATTNATVIPDLLLLGNEKIETIADEKVTQCPALRLLKNKNIQDIKCNLLNDDGCDGKSAKVGANCGADNTTDLSLHPQQIYSSMATKCITNIPQVSASQLTLEKEKEKFLKQQRQQQHESSDTFIFYTQYPPEHETENAFIPCTRDLKSIAAGSGHFETDYETHAAAAAAEVELMKSAKDYVNQQELQAQKQTDTMSRRSSRKKDDMEQWVSDTFYSYFPGFNNEYQKRQNYLRQRQQEYQQNFLKHQMLNPPQNKQHPKNANTQDTTARSSNSMSTITATISATNANATATATATTTPSSKSTNKTDLEIIVNNPNYVPPTKYSTSSRPVSTRHKLLQDLRHTDLTQTAAGDGDGDDNISGGVVSERNRRSAKLESEALKKDYQRELMEQIEEKRRSIELMREKERLQDEALTRRLQEQLKTIQLEEQLEKEKQRAEKLRFDSEQNRIMREHLLAKLENDAKYIYAKDVGKSKSHDELQHRKLKNNTSDEIIQNPTRNDNKVYKYFSNSARHEYRRGRPLPADIEADLVEILPEALSQSELECFHLSDKICPMCDAPLRSYESCCLRCQRKLSLKLNAKKRERFARNSEATAADSSTTEQVTNDSERRKPTIVASGSTKGDSNEGDSTATAASGGDEKRKEGDDDDDDDDDGDAERHLDGHHDHSFSLVCTKCERFYMLCPTCVAKSDVCRACHRKRNVCMSCRRTLCTFCLDEIARGHDKERSHVNECSDSGDGTELCSMQNVDSISADSSFQVLQVNYAASQKDNSNDNSQRSVHKNNNNNNTNIYNNNNNNDMKYNYIVNNLQTDQQLHQQQDHLRRPPYSTNIERNSIFHNAYDNEPITSAATSLFKAEPIKSSNNNNNHHPHVSFEQLPKINDKLLSFDVDSSSPVDEKANIERVRKETDRRLSRYLKNYGDLAAHNTNILNMRSKSESLSNRGTQTSPESAGRRDIVLNEEYNLSMPLLREMPKITRKESTQQHLQSDASRGRNNIENLKRRWEIPAVQKFSISSTSPRVLTQVGAIRKQLQADRFFADNQY